MIALRSVHVHKMDTDSPFPAMAHNGAHFQSSLDFRFLNAEVNFNFRPHRILFFAQDAHPNRAQVGEETR